MRGFMTALAVSIAAMGVGGWGVGIARATCDTINASSGDDTIIMGREYYWNGFIWQPTGNNALSLCIADSTGDFDYVSTNCDGGDSANFLINGLGGSDVIVANQGGLFLCEGVAIGDWYSGWSFALYAEGGTGADFIFGSNNSDVLYSSDEVGTADSSIDRVCGFGADDIVAGDNNDSGSNFECLGGGAGSGDTCQDWDDSPESDQGQSCEGTWKVPNAGFSGTCANACNASPNIPDTDCDFDFDTGLQECL